MKLHYKYSYLNLEKQVINQVRPTRVTTPPGICAGISYAKNIYIFRCNIPPPIAATHSFQEEASADFQCRKNLLPRLELSPDQCLFSHLVHLQIIQDSQKTGLWSRLIVTWNTLFRLSRTLPPIDVQFGHLHSKWMRSPRSLAQIEFSLIPILKSLAWVRWPGEGCTIVIFILYYLRHIIENRCQGQYPWFRAILHLNRMPQLDIIKIHILFGLQRRKRRHFTIFKDMW